MSNLKKYSVDIIRSDKTLQSKVLKMRKQYNDAVAVINYLANLKSESMADIGQITTISKQRIKGPVHTTDILANVIIPDDLLKRAYFFLIIPTFSTLIELSAA